MVKWNEWIPTDIEYDWEADKLRHHGLTYEEAEQCFFNGFEIRQNKQYTDRYKLYGHTDAGRALVIIFQLKPGNIVRIITGWQKK